MEDGSQEVDSMENETSVITVTSPIDGEVLGTVSITPTSDVPQICRQSQEAFLAWRTVPAPKRGELIRLFGNVLRENKLKLGTLVTQESGKILQEGLGEVQEMIDICDFAVGLSRQLYGLTISSERPGHRMMEQWLPNGPVVVISAFNFPVAVWAWNAALALVCGNPVIWKPSEKTPKTAVLCSYLFMLACQQFEANEKISTKNLSQVVQGHADVAKALIDAREVKLVSATGSCRMGRAVRQQVAGSLGKRCLLELGGNNAMIVTPSADIDMTVRAILFSAVGTAGQRCTSLRRLFVHDDVYDTLIPRLVDAYKGIKVGNPLDADTLVGPLIDYDAVLGMQQALDDAGQQGGTTLVGGGRMKTVALVKGMFRHPAIVAMPSQTKVVCEETFAPILYVMRYSDLSDVIAVHNEVDQGLSSSIFTMNVREAELFMSAAGSDCGIANVNIGPSGAEIGGAFGGEKDTGGGRESGSDAWKVYMRRTTNTINYSDELPLAQGITFGD